jgi:nucleotide-binding universal stress UspA family protein
VGLKSGTELADHFSAELILVHVVSPYPSPPGGEGLNLTMYFEEIVNASKKSLEEVAKNRIAPNLQVRTIVLQGNPAEQIIALAGSEKADMIVTATHGWTGWRRFIFGSIAERVVRLASCPVMTVPAPQAEQ